MLCAARLVEVVSCQTLHEGCCKRESVQRLKLIVGHVVAGRILFEPKIRLELSLKPHEAQ